MPNTFTSLINIPAGVSRGVDLSHYNGNVDWAAIVAAGVTFVYIKASDGIATPDHTAAQHAADAQKNHMQFGYYHFCRPKTRGGTVQQAAIAEANDTLSTLATLPKATMPLVLDLESTTPESTLSQADYLQWVHSYIGALPAGTNVMIYTYKAYLDTKIPSSHDLGKYPLWLARYTNDGSKAVCPVGWKEWKIWQFEGAGALGGNPQIDLSIMRQAVVVAPPVVVPPTPFPGKSLQQGDNGDAVKQMQHQLGVKGFGPITADGDFGAQTKQKVMAFQTAHKLTADGVVGPKTWNMLFS